MAVRPVQLILLNLSYFTFSLIKKYISEVKLVVGVDEIASNIFYIKNIVESSVSVCLGRNKFYNLEYDYCIKSKNKYLIKLIRIIYGPLLLGYLANKTEAFFYIWHTGFLLERDYEFKFLKSKNKKIICLFVGNDIRSLKLTYSAMQKKKLDCRINYHPNLFDEKYDYYKKMVAIGADKYADLIFNNKSDQISYLQSEQHPWIYIYDRKKFRKCESKFSDFFRIKILHAPSNPINKGTPLVRAAIKKLELQKYDFEYIELHNVSNQKVLDLLRTSHIVLNQFYSSAPGLFGVEGMANNCAVLMSADPSINEDLPVSSKDAWMITKYWQVYDNLKHLLDNPEKIQYYADRGYDFALKNYTFESAGKYVNKVLKVNDVF